MTLLVAWDLDYTVVWSNHTPHPARITSEHNPYTHHLLEGRLDEIKFVITGRPVTESWATIGMLKSLGISPKKVAFNPIEDFDQQHIASMKTGYLIEHGVDYYVEENADYRRVMHKYWDGECISVSQYCDLFPNEG